MNKIVFTGFMAAILGVSGASAAVTDSSLTTKGYVDAGLRAVNAKANSAQQAATAAAGVASSAAETASAASTLASSLQTIVGADANSGLQGTVGSLNTAVTALNTAVVALDSDINDQTDGLKVKVAALEARPLAKTYTAGSGISIDSQTGAISVNAFESSTQTGNTDKTYVIKNGELVEWDPDTVDTWDSSILD